MYYILYFCLDNVSSTCFGCYLHPSSGAQLQRTSTSYPLHIHFISTSFPFHIYFISISYPLHTPFTFTSYPLHIHFTSTSHPLHTHFIPTSYPLHFHFISTSHPLHIHSPIKMEQTQCTETSVIKHHTPRNNPKDYTQHLEHGASSKSRSNVESNDRSTTFSGGWKCCLHYSTPEPDQ
jgi:hypothetical protein